MYKWEGMEKIGYTEALKRFESGGMVFLLYHDDTEAEAINIEDIKSHQGEFGYEK